MSRNSNLHYRALLEAYEELCRLGIWDFAVDLSGADLPLRSMEDLSLALAPHRNQSFMAFHGLGYKNAPHQMDSNAMKGLTLGKSLLKIGVINAKSVNKWGIGVTSV